MVKKGSDYPSHYQTGFCIFVFLASVQPLGVTHNLHKASKQMPTSKDGYSSKPPENAVKEPVKNTWSLMHLIGLSKIDSLCDHKFTTMQRGAILLGNRTSD